MHMRVFSEGQDTEWRIFLFHQFKPIPFKCIQVGFCPSGLLSQWAFVLVGFCPTLLYPKMPTDFFQALGGQLN